METRSMSMGYKTEDNTKITTVVGLWDYATSKYGDDGVWIGIRDSIIQICKFGVIQELVRPERATELEN